MKFQQLDISAQLLKTLTEMGFEEMTPVQEATYSIISSGQDLCALAETGSGKTAACAIPLLQKIDPSVNTIQALVIVPTRELCLQYVSDIQNIASRSGVVAVAVYGGVDKRLQVAKLKHQAHILVATPGRLIDLMYSGIVEFPDVKCAVLDETDELLEEGFIDDITFILSCIRSQHQTLLFSATMNDDTQKIADSCLHNPQHISLISERKSPASIEHFFAYLQPQQKQAALLKYLKLGQQTIIFCNSRHRVDSLFRTLQREITDIEYTHAGLSQEKRTSIFRKFKSGELRCLIATDVAGRGLDFSKVSLVVNWDLPNSGEQYTHRTGRTGRMGRKGLALTFVTKQELSKLFHIIHTNDIKAHWVGEEPRRENYSRGRETQKTSRGHGRREIASNSPR